jgi:hypothetical protein
MAQIIPSDYAQFQRSGWHVPEIETLNTLRARLPADYTVFHGVHWTRESFGTTTFGELDIVIVNSAGRALVIEQKNGTLEQTASGLVKTYPDGTKSVGEQLQRSLDSVRQKFKQVHGPGASLDLDYLIFCPDHRVHTLNAAALDLSRIVDAEQRDRLAERIEGILGPGLPPDTARAERAAAFFRQTFEVVPDIHAHVSQLEKAFTRLTGPLVQLLANLEMAPLRLRIYGTAGCGKSLIAAQFFQKAVAQGKRPLLVCYNRPLAEKLKATLASGGVVTNFHGFCDQFLKSQGRTPVYDDWPRLVESVMGETIPDAWRFDAVIVDEGQDFEQEWVEVLRLFLRDQPDMVWLEDPDQNVRERPPVELPGFVGYRARINYRTPRTIAKAIQEMLPVDFEIGNPLPGLGVGTTSYADPAEQPAIVARLIDGLLRKGFSHSEIVILTMHGVKSSVFSERDRVGNFTLRRFTGEYDLFGNQVLTAGQITFDSVRRFKGQQAPAVILVDVEEDPAHPERTQRLLFTGMTRATVRVELVTRMEAAGRAAFWGHGRGQIGEWCGSTIEGPGTEL